MTAGSILALNTGSSSLKFGLFEADTLRRIAAGGFETVKGAMRLAVRDDKGVLLAEQSVPGERLPTETALQHLFDSLQPWLEDRTLAAVGHRIVHGGTCFVAPVALSEAVVRELDTLTPIAPLHQPACLEPVRALMRMRPGLPQIGCFDTAFHSSLAPPVSRYALPRDFEDLGIRRYGFHGLSYEFIAGRLGETCPEAVDKRTVVAHLGSGCSLCAIRRRRSVDTTMGFTALDGLMMATRPGAIDPGIILYLQQVRGMSLKDIESLLYHRCGLLGVSGISGDVRDLLASDHVHAAEALDLFAFRIARDVAAMANTLQGLDVLVFTGGVGEHAWQVRAAVCERLGWLGARLDAEANRCGGRDRLSDRQSRIDIYVMKTDEELTIARHVRALIGTNVTVP